MNYPKEDEDGTEVDSDDDDDEEGEDDEEEDESSEEEEEESSSEESEGEVIRSPKTRSRGNVKINLWSLNDE